ncbi:MAG: YybH family protein [Streptosporangiaceae bacterium]
MSDPIEPLAARGPQEALELLSQALSDGDLEAALAQYEGTAMLAPWRADGSVHLADDGVRDALTWFMALRLPLSVRIGTVLATSDLALVTCERRIAGTDPDGKPVRLAGHGCAIVRPQPDGAWRIAADAWHLEAEHPEREHPECERLEAGPPLIPPEPPEIPPGTGCHPVRGEGQGGQPHPLSLKCPPETGHRNEHC